MVLGKLDSYMQMNKTGPLSYPIYKSNFKWMKDLNLRKQTIKIIEEITDSNLFDISHSNFLPEMTPEARETKANTHTHTHTHTHTRILLSYKKE